MNNRQKQFIIGSGFIAKKFKKYLKFIKKNEITIYAAGISNSLEKNNKNFTKEVNRFKKFCKENQKKVIYISTYSIGDFLRAKKKYVKNKIKIENMIKKKCPNYLIIRLPEIVGQNKNPNSLTNFFFNKIKSDQSFDLFKKTKRNLLDVDDALENCIKIIRRNMNKNKTVNLLNNKFYSPSQIINILQNILNKKAIYEKKIIKKNTLRLKNIFFVKTNKNYLKKILIKYYK